MKLEVGKKYVCRDRPDIKYVEIINDKYRSYHVVKAVGLAHYTNDEMSYDSWYLPGHLYEKTIDKTDLIAEYVEAAKTKKIKVWDWYMSYGRIITGTEELKHYGNGFKIPGTEREIEIPE